MEVESLLFCSCNFPTHFKWGFELWQYVAWPLGVAKSHTPDSNFTSQYSRIRQTQIGDICCRCKRYDQDEHPRTSASFHLNMLTRPEVSLSLAVKAALDLFNISAHKSPRREPTRSKNRHFYGFRENKPRDKNV